MKGEQGDVGIRGNKGERGDHGFIGDKGVQGFQVSQMNCVFNSINYLVFFSFIRRDCSVQKVSM